MRPPIGSGAPASLIVVVVCLSNGRARAQKIAGVERRRRQSAVATVAGGRRAPNRARCQHTRHPPTTAAAAAAAVATIVAAVFFFVVYSFSALDDSAAATAAAAAAVGALAPNQLSIFSLRKRARGVGARVVFPLALLAGGDDGDGGIER